MKNINVEAEGSELILKNSNGDYAIIPVKDRNRVKQLLNAKRYSEIDNYVSSLPKTADYASDGTLLLKPSEKIESPLTRSDPFNPYSGKVLKSRMPYKEAPTIQTGTPVLDTRKNYQEVSVKPETSNPVTNTVNVLKTNLNQNIIDSSIQITKAQELYQKQKETIELEKKNKANEPKPIPKYSGCVEGMCRDMAESNKKVYEDMRKLNNLYGDAWEVSDNMYGKELYNSLKGGSIPNNLAVNDIVIMSRNSFSTDKARGIPEKNQHIGRISKIENGVAYVKHYVGANNGGYLEEPINNISKFTKYTPSIIKRSREFDETIVPTKGNFKLDNLYEPTTVEADVVNSMNNNKEIIQSKLKLTSDEYDRLAKLAYGVIGAESKFGASKRALYRMAVPDIIQKGVKVVVDANKLSDSYDDNLNNLSQGYGSNKESSQFNVGRIDGKKMTFGEMNKDIKSNTLSFDKYDRNTNYAYHAFNVLGIDPDKLENGDASFKAVIATLSQHIKKNPNITDEQLLSKYTGKKGDGLKVYKNEVDRYQRNMNDKSSDNVSRSGMEDFYAWASDLANKGNAGMKKFKNEVLAKVRDASPLSDNVDQMVYDLLAGDEDFTEKSLNQSTYAALKEVVKNNLAKGKTNIEYGDYNTSKNKNSDVGAGGVSMTKILGDDKYALKTLLGQATIIDKGNGIVEVVDQYNFNDKGKSFGVVDDLIKRGVGPYQIARALSRNYGAREGQGSKVRIRINLNEE